MKFKMGDIIDDEYLVVDSLKLDGKEYVYVNFDNNKNTILEVSEENGEDYINNIDDDNEFEKIMNAFAKKLSEVIEEK